MSETLEEQGAAFEKEMNKSIAASGVDIEKKIAEIEAGNLVKPCLPPSKNPMVRDEEKQWLIDQLKACRYKFSIEEKAHVKAVNEYWKLEKELKACREASREYVALTDSHLDALVKDLETIEHLETIEQRTKEACFEIAWPILLRIPAEIGLYAALKRELKQAIESVEVTKK